MRASGSPWPSSSTATVPLRSPDARGASSSAAPSLRAASVASTAEERYGPGKRARPSSSWTTTASTRPSPRPPCASGTRRPSQPRPASFCHRSSVKPRSSSSMRRTNAMGASAASVERTASRSASCSGLKVNSTGAESKRGRAFAAHNGVSVRAMDFAFTPEDEVFRAELRSWLDGNLPAFRRRHDEYDGVDEVDEADEERTDLTATMARRKAWQRRLHEGRWAAINWPREWGGREASIMQNVIYSEEMARARAPGIFNANGIWQIGPMTIRWANAEQKS